MSSFSSIGILTKLPASEKNSNSSNKISLASLKLTETSDHEDHIPTMLNTSPLQHQTKMRRPKSTSPKPFPMDTARRLHYNPQRLNDAPPQHQRTIFAMTAIRTMSVMRGKIAIRFGSTHMFNRSSITLVDGF